MARLATRHLALLALATLALALAPRAKADPSSWLVDPDDFSGEETLLTFDDLGLGDGNDVPSVDGVEFVLSGGGAAKYMADSYPREFGPQDPGSVNNFWDYYAPFPDLQIRFPAVMHRLGFELRASDQDDISVTLLSSGVVVDEVTTPSRGPDQFYFYGLENLAGFDEVLLDVKDNASGAFILDNLAFEALGLTGEEGEEGPSLLACVGFSSPLEALLEEPGQAPFAWFVAHWLSASPVKLLRARLLDEEALEVGDADLVAPPLARVFFTSEGGEETLDVTADVTWKDWFTYNGRGYWRLALKRYEMWAPGTYLVTMESGDEAEYRIDPACSKSITQKAPKRHHFRKR